MESTKLIEHPLSHSLERVTDDDRQHDGADEGIEPITLPKEVKHGKQHAHHGSEDEHQHAHLNPTDGGETEKTVEDAVHRGESGRMWVRIAEVKIALKFKGFATVIHQIDDAANEGDDASDGDADAKCAGNEVLYGHKVGRCAPFRVTVVATLIFVVVSHEALNDSIHEQSWRGNAVNTVPPCPAKSC